MLRCKAPPPVVYRLPFQISFRASITATDFTPIFRHKPLVRQQHYPIPLTAKSTLSQFENTDSNLTRHAMPVFPSLFNKFKQIYFLLSFDSVCAIVMTISKSKANACREKYGHEIFNSVPTV